jgi:uridine kinase
MKSYKEFIEEKINWDSYGNWMVSNNTGNFEIKYRKNGNKYDVVIVLYSKKDTPMFSDFEEITRKYKSSIFSRGTEHTFKITRLTKHEFNTLLSEIG